ncbi:MAG TPA: NADH-quinone oxidoreductase subunit M [Fimbriiglobus sp.]|jgi:NADH-quinone oxidoreductase subunit M
MDDLGILRTLVLALPAAPLAAACVCAALGRVGAGSVRRFAVGFAVVHLAAICGSVLLAGNALQNRATEPGGFTPFAVPGASGFATAGTTYELFPVTPAASVQFYLGLDGFNLPLLVLAAVMTLFAILVTGKTITDRPGSFFGWLFVLEAFCLAAFLSFDVLLFYAFFELTLIPSFFLIGRWGVGGGRRDAARKFFLYTLFGSLFTLVGIVGTVLENPTPIGASGMPSYEPPVGNEVRKAGPLTFSIPQLMKNVPAWEGIIPVRVMQAEAVASAARVHVATALRQPNAAAKREAAAELASAEKALAAARKDLDDRHDLRLWLFLALAAGFLVKIPIVPFHTWLPAAYGESPLGITLYLAGALAKLGTFGMLRVVIPLAPDASVLYGLPLIGTLAAVGIVYAAFCAYAQSDLKLLAAYSSVSHLGFLALGLFALNTEGFGGALLHMINHAASTGMLFALLAFLYDRYRTTDSNSFGGLIAKYPRYAFFFMVAALAGVGLPGLCNFPSEMLMMAGLFDARNTRWVGYGLAATAAAGIFLSSWYAFTAVRKILFGPVIEPAQPAGDTPPVDTTRSETRTFVLFAALCLALGLFPQPILDTVKPEAETLAKIVTKARERVTPGLTDPIGVGKGATNR